MYGHCGNYCGGNGKYWPGSRCCHQYQTCNQTTPLQMTHCSAVCPQTYYAINACAQYCKDSKFTSESQQARDEELNNLLSQNLPTDSEALQCIEKLQHLILVKVKDPEVAVKCLQDLFSIRTLLVKGCESKKDKVEKKNPENENSGMEKSKKEKSTSGASRASRASSSRPPKARKTPSVSSTSSKSRSVDRRSSSENRKKQSKRPSSARSDKS